MSTPEEAECLTRLGIGSHHAYALRLKREVDATYVIARDGRVDAVALEHADDHLGLDARADDGDDSAHRLMMRPSPEQTHANGSSSGGTEPDRHFFSGFRLGVLGRRAAC